MAISQKQNVRSVPLTLDVPQPLLEKMLAGKKATESVSEVVRSAIERFDFDSVPDQSARKQQQISVRLPSATKTKLAKLARRKGTGVGNLVRLALEASLKGAKKRRR